jgi:hypothetical protein
MFEREKMELSVEELAEKNFVEAYANLSECKCTDEHRLHVALSEQRGNPKLFAPEHKGIGQAYCGTFGRRCGF